MMMLKRKEKTKQKPISVFLNPRVIMRASVLLLTKKTAVPPPFFLDYFYYSVRVCVRLTLYSWGIGAVENLLVAHVALTAAEKHFRAVFPLHTLATAETDRQTTKKEFVL